MSVAPVVTMAEDNQQVGVLFPGQGSQYQGMVDPWLEHPAGRAIVERASAVLGWDVAERSRDADALSLTEVVQPAVFTCDLAAFAVLEAEGVRCDAAAGHSLGEYAALVAAGAVDLEPALSALAARAEAMGSASRDQPGAMTALIMPAEEAREVCEIAGRGDVLVVANENGARQSVLSGSVTAVERAEELARSRGGKAMRLPVAGAFHSPLMKPALQPVREALSRVEFRDPAFTIVPNVSGKPTRNRLVLRDVLSRHLVSPVRWEASMQAMAELGVSWFLEAGPGDVLGKLAKRAVPGSTVRAVGSPADARAVVEELRSASQAKETKDAPTP
jgi:[acyl-carrier-protein] S-malonyltransferase